MIYVVFRNDAVQMLCDTQVLNSFCVVLLCVVLCVATEVHA